MAFELKSTHTFGMKSVTAIDKRHADKRKERKEVRNKDKMILDLPMMVNPACRWLERVEDHHYDDHDGEALIDRLLTRQRGNRTGSPGCGADGWVDWV